MRILITGGSGFIGSRLIEELLKNREHQIVNIDLAEPLEKEHLSIWQKVDLLDRNKILQVFQSFSPNYVIHLAARTDTEPNRVLNDYLSNTDGTANVLGAIKACPTIERVIITSTQFVHQRHGTPEHDEDFAPHTVYGESKVITEQLTRQANLGCCWTIIRPTNIWGPRHPRYPHEFWRVLKLGRYVHPGRQPVIRSYGYVGTVVDQIITIWNKSPEEVNKLVLYVGDAPINLYDWVNGFSLALNGKNVRVVSRLLVRTLALAGDILRFVNVKFPITTSRFRSMTEENTVPMEKTFSVLGKPKQTLEQGIAETVDWLKRQNEFWR